MTKTINPHALVPGLIRRPLGAHSSKSLLEAVDWNWSLHQEVFDNGGILRLMEFTQSHSKHFRCAPVDVLWARSTDHVHRLRVAHSMPVSIFDPYAESLNRAWKDGAFNELDMHPERTGRYDIWWDVENNTIMSYDRTYIQLYLPHHLVALMQVLQLDVTEAKANLKRRRATFLQRA